MTKEYESSASKTSIDLNKNLSNPETKSQTTRTTQDTLISDSIRNPNKRLRQQSSEMQSSPSISLKPTETNNCMDTNQLKSFPPYSIIPKNALLPDQCTDRKLIEHLILEWKKKNGIDLDITGRFGHDSCLLIFANNESSFEELYCRSKWPDKLHNVEFNVKAPRIFPAAYSVIIQQFFSNWNIGEVLDELKTTYPSIINITRMKSNNNKPLNLVRADFCSLAQCKKILNDGKITIGHMKNPVKQYYPPVKINKCMKCFSHQHNTRECTSLVQLCIRCGTDHPFNNDCQNEIKCANCGQDHYAGHSSCTEVQQIRKQISQNQKIKRAQLLINQEQMQHSQYKHSDHLFPPIPTTPVRTTQGPNQHQQRSQPQSYLAAVQSNKQQTWNKNHQQSNHIENILSAFTNKIEFRLQQLEERLVNQVIELDKKIDNLKTSSDEIETIVYEMILPAIKSIQRFCLNNTRNNSSRDELTKYSNEVSDVLSKRCFQSSNSNNITSMEVSNGNSNRQTRQSVNKSKQSSSNLINDSE